MPVRLLKPVAGKRVLYVMAADPEYGPHLEKRFTPLVTGVGPVEAGTRLAIALARMEARDTLPDLVVSIGSAGSRKLEHTGIYQAIAASYRDMDASALGFDRGVTPFLELPAVVELPLRIPGIREATISTGGSVVSGAAYDAIDAEMVDMETFAVLRACMAFSLPLVGLRGISDGASELTHVGDWTEYLHVIDEKLAAAVDRLEDAIGSGLLDGLAN
ncbi:MAG: 5'-methylthioadenosine/S-adenosylhomocysteine nucleosidase [Notoacmeibacter sp.]|nr:5'-methylthioadenosine/S-adenosylhomocysteine nucleosidase [Notoacmeibacter sp.]